MEFRIAHIIQILEKTPETLITLLSGLPKEITHTNEGADTWSAFDVVGHLIHGEKTDWIPRLKIALQNNSKNTFESFDRFAQFEQSKGKELGELLTEFKQLRAANIKVLNNLCFSKKQLQYKATHPELGLVTIKELLSTWAVHDLSHINQITRVMAKQYKDHVGPWRAYIGVLDR